MPNLVVTVEHPRALVEFSHMAVTEPPSYTNLVRSNRIARGDGREPTARRYDVDSVVVVVALDCCPLKLPLPPPIVTYRRRRKGEVAHLRIGYRRYSNAAKMTVAEGSGGTTFAVRTVLGRVVMCQWDSTCNYCTYCKVHAVRTFVRISRLSV